MTKSENSNFVWSMAVIVLFVIAVFAIITIQVRLNNLKETKEKLEKQIAVVTDTIDELTIRLNSPLTEEYVERVVRNDMGLHRPDEIVFYNDFAN